jgi:hypothetical protein
MYRELGSYATPSTCRPGAGRDPYMDAPGLQEQSFHDDDTRSRLQPYIRSLLQPSIWLLTHDEIR